MDTREKNSNTDRYPECIEEPTVKHEHVRCDPATADVKDCPSQTGHASLDAPSRPSESAHRA